MNSDKIRVDAIIGAGPCEEYTRDRVADLWDGRDGLTPREISELCIPVEDRLWALIYVVLNDRQRRLFACDCAERALQRERDNDREPDPRGWAAIEAARKHAVGAATAAEMSAAGSAARSAAGYAAWSAAESAAESAASSAARSAASSAEQTWQLVRALKYAEESNDE